MEDQRSQEAAAPSQGLTLIAEFKHQVTGVAVVEDARRFRELPPLDR